MIQLLKNRPKKLKGRLERGSDVDIVIIDPNEEIKIKDEKLHKNNLFPFEEMAINKKNETVFIRRSKLFNN